jgi:hypothetical protein
MQSFFGPGDLLSVINKEVGRKRVTQFLDKAADFSDPFHGHVLVSPF